MKIPSILIIGNSTAGKSTAATILAEHFGCGWRGTSKVIMLALATAAQHPLLGTIVSLKYSEKFGDLFRVFLRDVGNRLRKDDPAYLVKECLKAHPIVEGVRTREEFTHALHLFDLVIWIDRPGTLPNETDELLLDDADVIIHNSRGLAELRAGLINAVRGIKNENTKMSKRLR